MINTSQIRTFLEFAKNHLTDILLLYISFSVSLNVRRLFNNPSDENYGVERIMTANPESNYIFILLLIFLTILLFFLLKYLNEKRQVLFRLSIVLILTMSFLIGIVAPSFSRYENNVDTFHHGEQLAPALAYEQGKQPYRDLFFLRGAGEDVIAPWLSFKIFGYSIGSYYLITGILQTLSFALFMMLVAYMFKDKLAFLFVSLWFTLSVFGDFFYARDSFVWLSLITIISLLRSARYQREKLIFLGFISLTTIFFSFDRGVFLLFLNFLLLATLLVKIFLKLKPKDNIVLLKQGIYFIGVGYVLSLLLVSLIIGPTLFDDFFKTTFLQAARYQAFIFNTDYPIFSQATALYWLPILVFIALTYQVFIDLKNEWPKISSRAFIELGLLLFSFIFFRAATGRPDSGHIAYGSPILFTTFFYLLFNRVSRSKNIFAPLVILIVACLSTSYVNYYKLPAMNQVPLKHLQTFVTAPSKPDEFWQTDEVETITREIKDRSDPKDYFFVFSSDPLYYYTTGLKNPTRYSISWFADASPLEDELLADLIKNPPKIVLYKSGTYYDRPEFISMEARLPKVNVWLKENYSGPIQIGTGDSSILVKR